MPKRTQQPGKGAGKRPRRTSAKSTKKTGSSTRTNRTQTAKSKQSQDTPMRYIDVLDIAASESVEKREGETEQAAIRRMKERVLAKFDLTTQHGRKCAFLAIYDTYLGDKKAICRSIGISRSILYDWIASDEEFAQAVQFARLQLVDMCEPIVLANAIADKNVGTAQWILERRRKGEYANRQELTGADGGPILSNQSPDEELARFKRDVEALGINEDDPVRELYKAMGVK